MPSAQRALGEYGQIEDLLAMVLAARGGRFERRVLASTLKVLAGWLAEQARLLADEEPGDALRGLRVVGERAEVGRLTRREREIAARIARGLSNRQIAEDLVIATSTTERHVANILAKLEFQSRTQIAAWAIENEL
jgi:DNA-binding NarL/FixJ family response regulator